MVKKKVDARIRTLIENGVNTRHRSFFILIGDHGRDQVVNLHYILSKATVKARPSVLWCYKKELGFTTHRQKRMRQLERDIKRGLRAPDEEKPFELFIGSTDIRYCYYKESHRILGSTFGMAVLQDFNALTPNTLARTIETVEGGGIVVILLNSMNSLKQIFSIAMDVHARFRTEAHQDVVGRFNERFLLSLSECRNCLVVDDELNILPISSHIKTLKKLPNAGGIAPQSKNDEELQNLKLSLKDTQPVGSCVEACRTLDQARAVLTFVEAISEKTLRSTVVLTAARGRGKSAALGLSIAAAVAYGYSNIFVTAPSPENLKTLFEMIFKGFDQLQYKEHIDYDIIQSTNPDFNKAVVRVNIFHEHRQTIQYISPNDHNRLAQAELLVIDEAAAIPLPVVRNLLGPYLVFMSSTVNGYEGTGRSLSLKLVKQLRTHSNALGSNEKEVVNTSSAGARVLREITLEEPIRYAEGDGVEAWLNKLLCLNCTSSIPKLVHGVPHPNECSLYYVERDTLFSGHAAAESFLQRLMALYVSSHYKNSPNDLQLMSDAPAHHLFVLLGPVKPVSEDDSSLPDVLCVIQVCLEGEISKASVQRELSRGHRGHGDLLPWTVSQQFQNNEFAQLSGARIVRIATHPELNKMGYGTRAMQLLDDYFQGKLTQINLFNDQPKSSQNKNVNKDRLIRPSKSVDSDDEDNDKITNDADSDNENDNENESKQLTNVSKSNSSKIDTSALLSEIITSRADLPPLLTSLSDRTPEPLHYLGVSYGLTLELFNYWRKCKFLPVYIRQTANELTGEHTCIMLKQCVHSSLEHGVSNIWLDQFNQDFKCRFLSLMSYEFQTFTSSLALSLIFNNTDTNKNNNFDVSVEAQSTSSNPNAKPITSNELSMFISVHDAKRLESYSWNLVDYHMIMDLVPSLARLFFIRNFDFELSTLQQAILLALGLQHRTVTSIEKELNVTSTQILAQFNKTIRKFVKSIQTIQKQQIQEEIGLTLATINNEASFSKNKNNNNGLTIKELSAPVNISLDRELNKGASDIAQLMKKKQADLLNSLALDEYAIKGSDQDWNDALTGINNNKIKQGTTISVKSDMTEADKNKRKLELLNHKNSKNPESGKKKSDAGSHKNKKVKN